MLCKAKAWDALRKGAGVVGMVTDWAFCGAVHNFFMMLCCEWVVWIWGVFVWACVWSEPFLLLLKWRQQGEEDV